MSIISQSINSYLNVFLCYSYDEQVTKLITKLKIASIMITLFVFLKYQEKLEICTRDHTPILILSNYIKIFLVPHHLSI